MYELAVTSTFSILIPITVGWIAYLKRADRFLRLFLLFLLFGFFVDCTSWTQHFFKPSSPLLNRGINLLYDAYSPIEAFFFFWVLQHYSTGHLMELTKWAKLLIVPLWLLLVVGVSTVFPRSTFSYFDGFYNVLVMFLAGALILHLIERKGSFHEAGLWFVAGIFMYNLSTFFVMLLKFTSVKDQLWYVHNVMNISTYLVYSVGFFSSTKDRPDSFMAPK